MKDFEKQVSAVKQELEDNKQRATSYDVARAAGVSQSAVSRCFKQGGSISKKMRERVQKVAVELGYQPNAIARSLITRRSNIVAVVINNNTNLYYPELLVELSRDFNKRGVHMLLFTLENESDVTNMLDQVWQYQVDGVILAAQLKDTQLNFFSERSIPFVYYNRTTESGPCNSVTCDVAEGERMLVDHLFKSKHKRFCLLTGPADSAVSKKRMQGALERLHELDVDDIQIVAGNYSYSSGYQQIKTLILEHQWQPDAIICANDIMALGAYDAAIKECNLSVPKDISIVGFDGAEPASWQSYQLTTVSQPLERMADAAVDILMQRIENSALPPEKRVFSGVFIKGKTCK
ncbi:LacI family DNA-binding transcriptional regulator [Alteromonas oceanisediminis]|uniref:LacI family DNA-binding transcriptional regulator n=1 Tax=Alteromonas oceanisediminis TaxID=2836180 RepID=UPI001BDAAD42|nr:LacI family DNA-binding transcriptional regulator [Alteromonas oceanisediminis]MBT0585595.1 LacI family DNA-binding transcriptional regulator [Alteromonas oceanisediminis]